jgi:hypothetical protein
MVVETHRAPCLMQILRTRAIWSIKPYFHAEINCTVRSDRGTRRGSRGFMRAPTLDERVPNADIVGHRGKGDA